MRKRICKNCGAVFEVPTGKETYLCEECAKKSKSNSVIRERTCKICGASFMGYPRSFFCPECSAERKKQRKKIYNRRKPSRPLGSVDTCEACGKEYLTNAIRNISGENRTRRIYAVESGNFRPIKDMIAGFQNLALLA